MSRLLKILSLLKIKQFKAESTTLNRSCSGINEIFTGLSGLRFTKVQIERWGFERWHFRRFGRYLAMILVKCETWYLL